MALPTNISKFGLLVKIVRYVWRGFVAVFLLEATALLILALYAPPTRVKPGADQGASGSLALPLPGGTEETFEPHISIDPSNVDHIVVAAQYGRRFGRAGTAIYQWTSMDGGKSWNGQTVPAAKFPGIFVADPVTAVGTSGEVYVASMFGNHAIPNNPFGFQLSRLDGGYTNKALYYLLAPLLPLWRLTADNSNREGGMAVARTAGVGHTFMPPVIIGGTDMSGDPGDKPWLITDNNPASAYRGSIYASWAGFFGKKIKSLETISSGLLFVYSRDGGTTFSSPEYITHHGFGVQLVVRPNGILDALYLSEDFKAVLHQQSSNGGVSFTPETVVAPKEADTLRSLPTLAVSPEGALLACWSEKRKSIHVVCETSEDGLRWSHMTDVVPNPPEGGVIAYPAAAATGAVWWVLVYIADADATRVVLYRSIDRGASFSPYATLATRRFGAPSFCAVFVYEGSCRYNAFVRDFLPGDYVGLAASGHRLAMAFALPRNDDPVGFTNVYAQVLDLPGESGASSTGH